MADARAAQAPAAAPDLAAVLGAIKDLGGRLEALESRQPRTVRARPRVPVVHGGRDDDKAVAGSMRRPGDSTQGISRRGVTDTRQRPTAIVPAFADGETVAINREAVREGVGRLVLRERVLSKGGDVVSDTERDVPKTDQATRKDEVQHLPDGGRVERRYGIVPLSWGEIIDRMPSGGVTSCRGTTNGFRCGQRVRIGDVCEACGFGPYVLNVRHATKGGEIKYRTVIPGMTQDGHPDGFLESELVGVA